MSISAIGPETGPVRMTAAAPKPRAVASATTSPYAAHFEAAPAPRDALDTLLAARAAQYADATLYHVEGRPLVDAAAAARLEAAAVARALGALGLAAETTLAGETLLARASERFGVAATLLEPAPRAAADAVGLVDWAAAIGFGPARAEEDDFLRARFAGVLLADMMELSRALAAALGRDAAADPLGRAAAAPSGEPIEAALRAAAKDGAAGLAAARARIVAEVFEARGVLNSAEYERRARRDLEMAPWLGSRAERVFDVVVASLMLIALSPLLLAVLALMAFEKGPVFFAQQRIGRGGKFFPCLKFRTMVPGAQAKLDAVLAADPELAREWAETQKLRNDPRVTKLGWFLRKTSVDELPQLINVLKGEMSLVGNRPIILDEADRWDAHFAAYKMTKPGLTGPWQIFFRSTSDYASRMEMLEQYYARASFLFDLRMVILTGLTPFDTSKAA